MSILKVISFSYIPSAQFYFFFYIYNDLLSGTCCNLPSSFKNVDRSAYIFSYFIQIVKAQRVDLNKFCIINEISTINNMMMDVSNCHSHGARKLSCQNAYLLCKLLLCCFASRVNS